MAETPAASFSGLTRRLVKDNVITEDMAREATQIAEQESRPVISILVEKGHVDSKMLAAKAAKDFGMPLISLEAVEPSMMPTGLVDTKLVSKHHALPLFKRGTRIFIAVSDPTNLAALDDFTFNTGLSADVILADETALSQAIKKYLESQDSMTSGFDDLGDVDLEGLDVEAVDEDAAGGEDGSQGADEAPIVRFVNKILIDAIKGGSSDIHVEPYEKAIRVRFRTDGVLHEVARPPLALASRIIARLKVMSQMDISERRKPQDGRIKMKLSKTRAIDFRVNTLPCLFGEKVVMRILDPSSAQMGIDALGYEDEQKQMYMEALSYPQGMILVTGPTGSGKTVSLYTGLNILNTPDINISTAEDPVEINLEGINQCQMNPKVGLNFSEALRSFLRQDPDVIMVGEIRDLETAEIAIKAAQTGHMVMSTLHTNSAAETITRLLNMGVPAFNLATTVNLIIAQRLGRRVCKNCSEPHTDIPKDALLEMGFKEDELDDLDLRKHNPKGCDKCHEGYKGRVGVYEVVKITPKISRIIMEGGNSIEINEAMRAEGFNDLRRSALNKAKWGQTTLEEVNRVTKD
ncbi:MAG: type IV-A pilus assembly ATPase PilB [Gammaproteobacteria bacterium]|nr:MAG: type IV-A pilus assembly ATPase PilB [Gammaproteobacteria bacterium]